MTSITGTEQVRREGGMPRLLLWTGPKHSGKTTLLQRLVRRTVASGFAVAGFVAPSRYVDGELVGFDIVDVNTSRRVPLAIRQEDRRNKHRFTLLPEGLKFGMDSLQLATLAPIDIIVVDEYGPLELAHGGWWAAVDHLLTSTVVPVLLVVRKGLTDRVRQEYDKTRCVKLSAHRSQSAGKVMALLRERWIETGKWPPDNVETSLPVDRRIINR